MPPSSASPSRADVTVLGCGLMGSALVRALAADGHRVAAWNRTHERAAALAADGIEPIDSLARAVEASPLVLACLSTYDSVRTTLDEIDLDGRTLVNLTSGTPDGATELAEWAVGRGIPYLDGVIIAFPDFIGAPEAILAYSGPQELWEDNADLLGCLGGHTQWIGEEVSAANVFDGALIASFYTAAVGAYVEAATYALDHGVPQDLLRAATRLVLRTIGHSTKEAAGAIASGDFSTDQAKLGTYATATRGLLESMRGAGLPARFLNATVASLEAAAAAGFADQGIYAQAHVTRGTRA